MSSEMGKSKAGVNVRMTIISVFSMTILFSSLMVSFVQIIICNNAHAVLSGSTSAKGLHFIGVTTGGKNSVGVTMFSKSDFESDAVRDAITNYIAKTYPALKENTTKYFGVNKKQWEKFAKAPNNEENLKKALSSNFVLLPDKNGI